MTHFTDADIGDLAEEVLGTLEGMQRALRTKLPAEIAISKERERKLKLVAVRILEQLGRRPMPATRPSMQLTMFPSDGPTGLPD